MTYKSLIAQEVPYFNLPKNQKSMLENAILKDIDIYIEKYPKDSLKLARLKSEIIFEYTVIYINTLAYKHAMRA